MAPACQHSDDELARSLAKLWPHRLHESNCLKQLLCAVRLHRWHPLDLQQFAPGREVLFCRWCEKVRIDGPVFPRPD